MSEIIFGAISCHKINRQIQILIPWKVKKVQFLKSLSIRLDLLRFNFRSFLTSRVSFWGQEAAVWRAPSHGPGWPCWPSCLPSKSFVKFSMMCSCERVGWFSSRGIGFSNEISQAMIGVKVKTLCSVMFPWIWHQDFSSRKPGWNYPHEAKRKFVPVSMPAWSTGLMWGGSNKSDKGLLFKSTIKHVPYDQFCSWLLNSFNSVNQKQLMCRPDLTGKFNMRSD